MVGRNGGVLLVTVEHEKHAESYMRDACSIDNSVHGMVEKISVVFKISKKMSISSKKCSGFSIGLA